MPDPVEDIAELAQSGDWSRLLDLVVLRMAADSGTLHLLGSDDLLHLVAASASIPAFVLETVRTVPVGKGMAGLAVERRQPVDACNIQTDTTGDVRPGARATGLQGSIVVPLMHQDQAIGALGVANRHERSFTDNEQQQLLEWGRRIAGVVATQRG